MGVHYCCCIKLLFIINWYYIEDLNSEGAQGIVVVIKRCQPEFLTICEEPES
ncbi:MAG TPA: hypothetical protein DEV81_26415 [Cyanobacteria bacterium UBA11049]|nr:hypothetical protein [Cyanobacteria bacterium UBA11049]